jgi:broad specificity phosphatase PhoE
MAEQVLAGAVEPQPEPQMLESEELPDGWGAKFSSKRRRWYIYSLANPKDSVWKPSGWLPPPGHGEVGAEEPAPQPESAIEQRAHRRIVVVRHGYRLDEADPRWPERALRPQDSPLASAGQQQAAALGDALVTREQGDGGALPIVKVLASPFARTVQTAAVLASALGLGAASLGIEEGLSEEARHMARNKLCTEPWTLPPADLCVAAMPLGDLDHRYVSKVPVAYTRGAQYPGRPLELPLVPVARTPGSQQQDKARDASSYCPRVVSPPEQARAQAQEQQQQIFFDRVARLATDVATAPEWVRHTPQRWHTPNTARAREAVIELLIHARCVSQADGGVVLVTHGAVCSLVVKTLACEGLGQRKRKAGQVRHTGCTELVQLVPGGPWKVVGEPHSVSHLPESLRTK